MSFITRMYACCCGGEKKTGQSEISTWLEKSPTANKEKPSSKQSLSKFIQPPPPLEIPRPTASDRSFVYINDKSSPSSHETDQEINQTD